MALSFAKQMSNWKNKTALRMELVFQESVQELAKEANTPRAKGGNIPVDTGFLINSLTAAVNSVPRGASKAPDGFAATDWDATPLIIAVNNAKIGDRVTIGYTANYAQYMEARYAFLRLAAQNWPGIVTKVTKRVDARTAKHAKAAG